MDSRHPVSFVLVNSLTLGRLIAGLVFPLVSVGWRLALVLAAAASDLVDGAISRRLHATSTFGRMLDPVADKTFVLMVVATLWVEGTLSAWQIALIGLRDWTVLGAAIWHLCARNRAAVLRMTPSWLGKATTGGQFVVLISLLFLRRDTPLLFWGAVILSGLAAADYLRKAVGR